MNNINKIFVFGLILVFLSAGCQQSGVEVPPVKIENSQDEEYLETPTPVERPSETPTPEPTFTPTVTPIVILDPDPIEISFEAEDGTKLEGIYYPADRNPAPLLVLVHWARGDQMEWQEIATWLQGRGVLEPRWDYNNSWKSSEEYPERSLGMPLGIFTFTLRECEGECRAYLPGEWLSDIRGAMETAAALQGVNREQILTAGASIGADGAAYGCSWINQNGLGLCGGSFLLSPASLLTLPFEEVAGDLLNHNPALPVYCLLGLRDDASVETCSDLPGLNVVDYGYIENHGMELIQPGVDPHPLDLLQEFIITGLRGGE